MPYKILSDAVRAIFDLSNERFSDHHSGPPAANTKEILTLELVILENELFDALTHSLDDKTHINLCVNIALKNSILHYFELGRENEIPCMYRHLYL